MNSHDTPRKSNIPVLEKPQVSKSARQMDQLCEQRRCLHYSLRPEEAYVYWVKNFIRFHGLKHRRDMGQVEIESLLTPRPSGGGAKPSTMNAHARCRRAAV